mgnify:CR=1 FL=1
MNNSEIVNAFADWVEPMPWQWFLTLTFARRVHSITAKNLFGEFIKLFNDKAIYVLVVEGAKYRRALVHIHCLVGNMPYFSPIQASKLWRKRYGLNVIEPYNKSLGARYYLGKYLATGIDWDIEVSHLNVS